MICISRGERRETEASLRAIQHLMTRKGWFSKASSQVNGHNSVSVILLRDIGKRRN